MRSFSRAGGVCSKELRENEAFVIEEWSWINKYLHMHI